MTPKEALNELKWRYSMDLKGVEIEYINRGAPHNRSIVKGEDIEVERSGIVHEGSFIPYHRITRITFNGELFFDRQHERDKSALRRNAR